MTSGTRTWRIAANVLTGATLLGASLYARSASRRLAACRGIEITDEEIATQSFVESHTVRDFVNPRAMRSGVADMHTVVLRMPLNRDISDEEILAQATKSFFNGWVFYPEAKALALWKPADTTYSSTSSGSDLGEQQD